MAFTSKGTIVRQLDNLTIIFWDAESIWVEDSNGHTAIFHRWFAPLGSYRGERGGERQPIRWRDFRRRMLRKKTDMTIWTCCRMAEHYGVQVAGTTRKLSLKGRKVIYRK